MQLFVCIKNKQNQIGIAECSFGSFHSDPFNHIHCFTDARSIQQLQRDVVDCNILFYYITRCSRNIGYNRFIVTGKRIEQGRFADIRAADDGCRDTFAQNLTFIGSFQQLINTCHNLTAFLFNKFCSQCFHIMLRVINVHFYMGQRFDQCMAQCLNALRQRTADLLQGNGERPV
ncbi:hypothetical protein D3C80_1177900 [compost metagenome]